MIRKYCIIFFFLISCPLYSITYNEVKELCSTQELTFPLFNALNKAGANKAELIKAVKNAPGGQKKAVEFLISFMPERDLRDLSAKYILENTALAFKAREKFAWAQKVPEAVFLNDVLPHATLNERRDEWRQDFFDRFSQLVANSKNIEEATVAINKNIKENLGVIYSTKRPKADQSPYESMECKMASCTGLSILLTNALRSVGIPSRIAGVPQWTNKNGNHNWNEVWIDGKWVFTEYYFAGLNKGWFLKDAAAADDKNWQKKIYATSFSPQQYWFPCVWDFNIRFVHAVDVSLKYKTLYEEQENSRIKGYRVAISLLQNINGPRVSQSIAVLNSENKKIAEGKTKGPEDDLNNFLEFMLPAGKYKVQLEKGIVREFEVKNLKLNKVILSID